MKKLLLLAVALFSFGFVNSEVIPLSKIDTGTIKFPFFVVTTDTEAIKYEIKTCNVIRGSLSNTDEITSDLFDYIIKGSISLSTSGGVLYSNTQYDQWHCLYDITVKTLPVYTDKVVEEFQILSSTKVVIDKLVNTGKSLVEFERNCIQETPGSKLEKITFREKDGEIDMQKEVTVELFYGEKNFCSIKAITDYVEPVVEIVVQEQQEEILSGNDTDPRIELFNSVRTKYIKENGSKKAMEMAKKFITAYLIMQGKLGDNEEIGKVIYKVFTDFIESN